MSNFSYSKTTNGNNKSSNDFRAGSTKCSIESIGVLNPNTNAYECEQNEWGFNMSIKFSNQRLISKVYFPSFLLNTKYDEKGKLDFRSHFNNNDFKVNGVFECNTQNMETAILNYTEKFVSWYTDLLNVYVPNGLSLTSNLLRMSEFKSKFYECYGYISEGSFVPTTEGNPAPEEKEGSKGKYYILEKEVLKKYEEYGYTFLCKAVSFTGEDDEEVLAQISQAVNNQMFIFSNMVIAEVISRNTGQTGYTFNTFVTSGDKSYLNPVLTLNSLVASVGSVKIDNEFVTVTPLNETEYPEFVRYYYGGIHGLNKKNMRYFDGEIWKSRLQFVFKKDEFNPYVEGTDLKVTYRSKSNPLLKMERVVSPISSIANVVNEELPQEEVPQKELPQEDVD